MLSAIFQQRIFTAGDEPNVLVGDDPAALQANREDVFRPRGHYRGSGRFTDSNLKRAVYTSTIPHRCFRSTISRLSG